MFNKFKSDRWWEEYPAHVFMQYPKYYNALRSYTKEPRIIINGKKYYSIEQYILEKRFISDPTDRTNFIYYDTQIKIYLEKFNEPVEIIEGAKDCSALFKGCSNFNQPVKIPNGVEDIAFMFKECYEFNQPMTLNKKYGYHCNGIFAGCDYLEYKNINYILGDHFHIIIQLLNRITESNDYEIIKHLKLVCSKLGSNNIVYISYDSSLHNSEMAKCLNLFSELNQQVNLGDIISNRGFIDIEDENLFAQLMLASL